MHIRQAILRRDLRDRIGGVCLLYWRLDRPFAAQLRGLRRGWDGAVPRDWPVRRG